MTPNSIPASSPEPAETPTLRLLPAPQPLRPDELTMEVAELLCEIIKAEGVADHLAGALVGVSRATFEYWRTADPAFALMLDQARAWFEIGLMRKIKDARKADGSPDWRAQNWLLKNASSGGFAKPARPAKPAPTRASKSANLPETPAAPPAAGARENTTILPETVRRATEASATATAMAGEKTTILPETRKAA